MTKHRLFLHCLALLCLLAGSQVCAQKLYFLSEGDRSDPNIRYAVSESCDAISNLINDNLPGGELVTYTAVSGDEDVSAEGWQGPDLSDSQNLHDDILKAIANCPAGPNDTIFFYWCGHGAYDWNWGQVRHYLLLPQNNRKRILFRSEILGALKKKRARLTVLITDSCNEYRQITKEENEAMAPACEPYWFKACETLPFLLFECRGIVDVNSSSPGQRAIVWEDGAAFSRSLVYALSADENPLGAENPPRSWSEVFNRVDSDMKRDMGGFTSESGFLGNSRNRTNYKQTTYRLSLPRQVSPAPATETAAEPGE